MDVEVTYASAVQAVSLDIAQRLVVIGNRCARKLCEQGQYGRPIGQRTAGDFTQDERMYEHGPSLQEVGEPGIALTKVVDPDRRVDQYQDLLLGRLRRGAFNPG